MEVNVITPVTLSVILVTVVMEIDAGSTTETGEEIAVEVVDTEVIVEVIVATTEAAEDTTETVVMTEETTAVVEETDTMIVEAPVGTMTAEEAGVETDTNLLSKCYSCEMCIILCRDCGHNNEQKKE